ncbi:hypothetical protein [Tahibacter aquaticus]|uniref:hypothetical protein n=1 Tax=Tahibacter aquaticus TaxID=520092 RepID=UPI001061EEFF|nr:hypothetical protein [Tahibacter aquaticus]
MSMIDERPERAVQSVPNNCAGSPCCLSRPWRENATVIRTDDVYKDEHGFSILLNIDSGKREICATPRDMPVDRFTKAAETPRSSSPS